MNPTAVLMQEHRVIEQVLDCLARIADDCQASGRLAAADAAEVIDFLRNFADRCHHGKEEAQLFPMMEARGYPADQGPTAVMRQEHVEGRARIRGMDAVVDAAGGGDAAACRTFVDHARAYVALLREHIQKEDHCLFPMADQALTEADRQELQERFRRVEHEDIGAGVHERYVRLADALAERWNVAARAAAAGHGGCGCGHTH